MTPKDSAGASFTDAIMENTEIWSNDACVGYFLRAAQIVGLDQADTRKVVEAFNTAFDGTSVDEAADIYCKYWAAGKAQWILQKTRLGEGK